MGGRHFRSLQKRWTHLPDLGVAVAYPEPCTGSKFPAVFKRLDFHNEKWRAFGYFPWWQKRKIPLKIFHVQNEKKTTALKVPFSFLNLEYSKKWRNWAEQHCHLRGVCNGFAHFTPTTVYLIRKRCPPSPDLAPNSKRWFLMLTISAEWLIKTRF